MKLSNIKTEQLHAFAKTLGIKNLKGKGRGRDVIIAEILEIKMWAALPENTVEFFIKGGEIEECRPQTNDKPVIGNQASAGKTKRKGQTEFDKRAKRFIAAAEAAFYKLSNKEQNSFVEFLGANGLNWGDKDMQIWGNGGLCDHCTRWGLKVKLNEQTPETKENKAPKEKRESKPKGERSNVTREGLVSLSSLCDKHGIDGKVARRKLRSKMEKPEAGWHFTPEQALEVEQIITK